MTYRNNSGTKLKIALVAIFVAFIISISLNAYFYTQQNGTTGEEGMEGQNEALQEEINNLKASKLVSVNLEGVDNRPFLQTPRLHISGFIFNVGKNTANDCKIHVVLYQGNVIAADTYINLGAIAGENGVSINEDVYYDGESLTDFTISPEWN